MKTLRTFLAVVGRPSQAVNKLLAALLMLLALNNSSVLSAGFYLTGAQIYQADMDGVANDSYRYTTNSHDIDAGAFRLGIQRESLAGTRQDRAITFELLTGLNSFEFNHNPAQTATLGTNYFGLNLFFSDKLESFNPPNVIGNSFAGHLTAVVEINRVDGAFSIIEEDTPVQNYDFRSNGTASANGRNSFSIGEYLVSLTSLSAANTNGPTGSFGLTVSRLQITAVPEPATLVLAALAGASAMGAVRKRKQKRSQTTSRH